MAAASGILMFVSSADRYAASPVFLAKMAAIAAGGANALILHRVGLRSVEGLGESRRAAWIRPTAAIVSMLVWLGVIVLGRSLGYELREPPEVDLDALRWLDGSG